MKGIIFIRIELRGDYKFSNQLFHLIRDTQKQEQLVTLSCSWKAGKYFQQKCRT